MNNVLFSIGQTIRWGGSVGRHIMYFSGSEKYIIYCQFLHSKAPSLLIIQFRTKSMYPTWTSCVIVTQVEEAHYFITQNTIWRLSIITDGKGIERIPETMICMFSLLVVCSWRTIMIRQGMKRKIGFHVFLEDITPSLHNPFQFLNYLSLLNV